MEEEESVCFFFFFLSCSGALKDSSGAYLDKDQPFLHPNTHESTLEGLSLREKVGELLAPAGPGWWALSLRAECMDCQGGAERGTSADLYLLWPGGQARWMLTWLSLPVCSSLHESPVRTGL